MLQVVVMGKSLGGAVALHLAAANPKVFRAIVIENTFLSIEDVAPKVWFARMHHAMPHLTKVEIQSAWSFPGTCVMGSLVCRCSPSWDLCWAEAKWETF